METQIAEVQSMYQERMYEIESPFTATKSTSKSGAILDDMAIASSSYEYKPHKKYSYEASMYPVLPSYSSTPVLQKNDFSPQFPEKRQNYADAWKNAGYIGTLSDAEKTLSMPSNTLKLQ